MLLFLVALGNVYAGGRPFITRWEGKAGEALKIPIVGKYTIVVKNAGGSELKKEEVAIDDPARPYVFIPENNGEYLVEAGPEGVEYIRMAERGYPDDKKFGSCNQLLFIEQFGDVAWTTMENAFRACSRMQFKDGIDKPNLEQVTNMEGMFHTCTIFNQPLAGWDVSKVTNMRNMFRTCSSFNQPLEEWDVSNVTNMTSMFMECTVFNQPLEKWNVSKVNSLDWLFSDCSSFNQPLEAWNVSNAVVMESMFHKCSAFNQPLKNWNVSRVTDMSQMFSDCTSFNQPLEGWDVSKVTGMDFMFSNCTSFDQPLGKWKLQKGLNLASTAMSALSYSQTLVDWSEQQDIARDLEIRANGRIYNGLGQTARVRLGSKGWTFIGDAFQGSGLALSPKEVHLGVEQECELRLDSWGLQGDETVAFSGLSDVVQLVTQPELNGQYTFRIKALKAGNITLKATSSKQNLEATCQVKVQAAVAPTQLTLNRRKIRLEKGQKVQFLLAYTPAEYVLKGYEVTTLPEEYIKVTKQSETTFLVEALKPTLAGTPVTLTVKAAHGGKEATCQVTVSNKLVAPTQLILSKSELALDEGGEHTLTVRYIPEANVLKGYTFTAEPAGYIDVNTQSDDALLIKAIKPTPAGTKVTFTVKAANGGKEAKCQVTVNHKLVEPRQLFLSSKELVLDEGGEETLTVHYNPEEHVLKGYTFTTEPAGYINVNKQSDDVLRIKAIKSTLEDKPVTLTVKAAHGGKEDKCQVTVNAKVKVAPREIVLNPATLELPITQSASLTLSFKPKKDVDKSVTITTEPEGYVTAELQPDGSVLVTAKDQLKEKVKVIVTSDKDATVSGSCEVNVVPLPAPDRIELSNSSAFAIQEEKEETLTITFIPGTGVDKTIAFTIEPDDGYISVVQKEVDKLLIKALRPTRVGTPVTLTVRTEKGNAEATREITVTPKPIAPKRIKLSEETLSLEKDKEQDLTVSYNPKEYVLKGYTFSTEPAGYIEVTKKSDDELHIKALQPTPNGVTVTLTVKAEHGGKEAKCQVKVTPAIVPPTSLSLSKNALSLYVGKKTELTVGFTPSQYVFREVSVTALPEGFVEVTEQDGVVSVKALQRPTPAGTPVKVVVKSKKDPTVDVSCDVTVLALQTPMTLSLKHDKLERYVGQRAELPITFTPAEDVNQQVSVSVTPDGFVLARVEGNRLLIETIKPTEAGQPVKVTLTSIAVPTLQASCDVTVLPFLLPEEIELDETKVDLYEGESKRVHFSFVPDKNIDPSVRLSVSPEGFVTARLEGDDVVLTALKLTTEPVNVTLTSEKASNVSASCQVSVIPPAAPTELTLNKNKLHLRVEGEGSLNVEFTPSKYVDKGLTVKTEPEGYVEATLQNGLVVVKALKPTLPETPVLLTIMSTKDATVRAMCEVTVSWNDPTKMLLSKKQTSLQEGTSEELTFQFDPAEKVEKGVKVEVRPEGFVTATVSDDKVNLVAVKPTPWDVNVTVTLTSTARSTVSAACTVTVTPKPVAPYNGGKQPSTAVEDALLSSIVVAPNPFTTQLRLGNPEGVSARYELVNTSGVVVRSGVLEGKEVTVETEALPTGIYFVRFYGANSAQKTIKVICY